jgi:hypothetical protein
VRTYFFHLRDGEDVLLDPDGRAFPSMEALIAATLYEARDVIANDAKSGKIKFSQHLDIEDDQGKIVHRLSLRDAVVIEGLEIPPSE